MNDRELPGRIVETAVDTIEVRLLCGDGDRNLCDGELQSTGVVRSMTPMHFLHKCDRCGRMLWSEKAYPFTRVEPRRANP